MKTLFGTSYRQTLPDNMYLDISVQPSKWHTIVSFTLWEEGNGVAVSAVSKKFINIDKILPMKIAKPLAKRLINRQSMKVAGFKLI